MKEIAGRSSLNRYGFAVLMWLLALGLTSLLGPLLARTFLGFFLIAVVLSSTYCGVGPGLVVTALSIIAGDYFFISPGQPFALDISGIQQLGLFGLIAIMFSWLSAMRLRAIQRARESERFLAIMLRSIGDAVIATDETGNITFVNPVARALTGWTEAEASGKPLADIFNIINETTRQRVENPVAKVLELGTVVGLANHTMLIARDGTEIPIEDSAAPIKDDSGTMRGVIMVFHDVTERRRVETEQRFLLQSTELLSSSLDYEATLKRVAQLAVPHIADWCAIDIVAPDGTLKRLSVAHVDPAKVEWAHELERKYPTNPDDPTGVYHVVRTGVAEFYPEIPREMLVAGAVDEEHMAIIDAIGFVSAMVVPLIVRGRALGAITLVTAHESGRKFTQRDLDLARELAHSAALAIDNSHHYHEAQRNAEALERQAARLSVLAETSTAFASAAINYQDLLATVARRLSQISGDGCVVRLFSNDDKLLEGVAIYHPDTRMRTLLEQAVAATPRGAGEGIQGEVASTGNPIMVNAGETEPARPAPKSNFHAYREMAQVSSFMIVPMRARGRVIGTISLSRAAQSLPYTDDDLSLLGDIADRAALVIDNARLYRSADEQLKWFQVTLSSIGDAVIATDPAGRITFMNQVAVNLTGWVEADALGEALDTVFDIVNEDTRERVESPVAKVLREGRIVGLANHTILIARDGREIPIDDSAAPIIGSDGVMRGVVLVFHDILARKEVEVERARLHEQVEQQRRRLDNLVSSMPGVVWEAWGEPDAGSQRIDFVSDYVERMLGYSKEAWLAVPNFWLTIVHPDDREQAAAVAAANYAGGGIGDNQFRWITRDGDVRWIDSHSSVILDEDGHPIGMRGVTMDVTDRKRAEEAIRESEARFRALADSAPVLIWMADTDAMYNYFNKGWLDFVGRRFEQEAGKGWVDGVHPDDHRASLDTYLTSFAARRRFTMEYRLRRADGEYRWVLDTGVPRLTPDGSFAGYIGSCMDIHDRKVIEEELTVARDAAEAANRAKDQFLAVLSHELRTPLTPVLATAQALESDEAVPLEVRPLIEVIRRNVELEVHLIDDLLDLVRVARGKLQLDRGVLGAHLLLNDVLQICRSDIYEKHLELSVELNAAGQSVLADPARLQQVLWNLIKNAVKFTPQGGRLAIRTSNPSPGMLAIEVADTGIGIEPDILPRIFNVFEQGEQTITRRFGGLGLGLAISKALVEMQGGTITAASQGANQGATFTVRIPTVAAQPPVAIESAGKHRAETTNTGVRILLVDDHVDTNTVMKMLLERRGYTVVAATTMQQGLTLGTSEHFDLLVSDIGLPDGSGLELMRELSARKPIKAIALSGFGMEGDIQRSREVGFSEHLTKPVTFQKLYEIIQRLISP